MYRLFIINIYYYYYNCASIQYILFIINNIIWWVRRNYLRSSSWETQRISYPIQSWKDISPQRVCRHQIHSILQSHSGSRLHRERDQCRRKDSSFGDLGHRWPGKIQKLGRSILQRSRLLRSCLRYHKCKGSHQLMQSFENLEMWKEEFINQGAPREP